MKVKVVPIMVGSRGLIPKQLTGRLRHKRTNRDGPEYTIIITDQNAVKSPGDLRRVSATQTPVISHQQTLVLKTLKKIIIIIIIIIVIIIIIISSSSSSARKPDLIKIKKRKKICKIVDFAFPADHRIKLKQWEKKDKYFDLAREF